MEKIKTVGSWDIYKTSDKPMFEAFPNTTKARGFSGWTETVGNGRFVVMGDLPNYVFDDLVEVARNAGLKYATD